MEHMKYTGYESEDKLSECSSASYGDFAECKDGSYIAVPYTAYSDYSGGTVERANCDEFLRLYGTLPGVWELYGGHGTRAVIITNELYETNEEIKDTIDALEDYPVINEDSLSELEMTIENESWDDWLMWDLKRALGDLAENMTDDEIKANFYEAAERANEYPIFEDAVSCFWHIDRIISRWDA